jgi:2-polyprenyl-6-methoxyphenol hydroxylase-like FAD-dependent oxidoreductase
MEVASTSEIPEILDIQQTDCCIVGGGPAGMVLSLLLARQGINVTLLELHKDFDRDFRGDTIHPSILEIMDQLGLAEQLLTIPHTKMQKLGFKTAQGDFTLVDFNHLKTKFPYIAIIPQVKFLEFIIAQARQYPNFQLITGANVQELVEETGVVKGVRYRGHGGYHEVRGKLIVGADGRFSRLRQLSGFEPIKTSPLMDVLWFRLPRHPEDGENIGIGGRVSRGQMLVIIDRGEYWQLGYLIFKGSYQKLRSEGIEAWQQAVVEIAPEFSDRLHLLKDWSQMSMLSVESSRLPQWYRPGLLLIGDAAHVMSPVGGVGINYAIQDAVVTANLLSQPLKTDSVQLKDLAAVQRQRELPTKLIQTFQAFIQKQIIARALDANQQFQIPFFAKLPFTRDFLARLIAFGLWRVKIANR